MTPKVISPPLSHYLYILPYYSHILPLIFPINGCGKSSYSQLLSIQKATNIHGIPLSTPVEITTNYSPVFSSGYIISFWFYIISHHNISRLAPEIIIIIIYIYIPISISIISHHYYPIIIIPHIPYILYTHIGPYIYIIIIIMAHSPINQQGWARAHLGSRSAASSGGPSGGRGDSVARPCRGSS